MVTLTSGKTSIKRDAWVEEVRQDFPILSRKMDVKSRNGHGKLAYLDNAATSQKPEPVLHAIMEYYTQANANVHRALYALGAEATALYEQSRRKIQSFIHAKRPEEVVFTRGTTESINLVASSLGRGLLKNGDEILLTEMEHHSNLIPWQFVSEERGCTLRFIPFKTNGTLDLDQLDSLWNDRIRIVSLVHVSNVLGTINNIQRVIQYAHERGVPVLIDSAQGVPHMPVDVQDLDCDFLAFSGHKMYGPTGIGILYGKEEWLNKLPPYMGGGDMIQSVWLDKAHWQEPPYKFEAGSPNVAGAVGLGSAVDYIQSLDMNQLMAHESELTEHAIEGIRGIPDAKIYGAAPERGSVVSFNMDGIHAHDMAQFLDSEGIAVRAGHHCAQPIMRKMDVPAMVRASFSFYNTHEEIELMLKALKAAREYFKRVL